MVFAVSLRQTSAFWRRSLTLVQSSEVQASLAFQGGVIKTFRWRTHVSFDLNVFTWSHEFPESKFLSLLAEFGATEERDADQDGRHWRTIIDESAIFCDARELLTDDGVGYEYGYRWRVGVSSNSGCNPRTRWAQFAVLSRWLILIPDSVAYDPQSGMFFDDADRFAGFAYDTFLRWPDLIRQLRRLNLVSPEGQVKF